jgi:hypothetical protein
VGANCHGSRVGVFMDMENNGNMRDARVLDRFGPS